MREAWRTEAKFNHLAPRDLPRTALIQHAEEEPTRPAHWGKGRPSIHMPRWASRITLEVTGVRVERLNAITEEDAMAEGVLLRWREPERGTTYTDDIPSALDAGFLPLPLGIYQRPGPDSWDANPWVFVVEFKRVTP